MNILIVGGGFGGVRCALDLARVKPPEAKIILVNDKAYFEYTPSLYRVVTGKSPLGACVSLKDIFATYDVEIIQDRIVEINLKNKALKGSSGSHYKYDYLVLALGSETAYFNIAGLKEFSFGFKSINEALKLKRHLHELFETCKKGGVEQKICNLHFVVVGGGASGVEIAGELAVYTKHLAEKHNIDPSLITIDLIEAGPKLLAQLPNKVSERVITRLRSLGVNIFLNRTVTKEDIEQVHLKDMEMKTKTVIWAAGVKPNELFSKIEGLELDKKGRVIVDEYLRAKGFDNVFVIGDGAATFYSGLAQTAIREGKFVAKTIVSLIKNKSIRAPYLPREPFYLIPVGPGWAAAVIRKVNLYGKIAWLIRRMADLRFFISILPIHKALSIFWESKDLCESCGICVEDTNSK